MRHTAQHELEDHVRILRECSPNERLSCFSSIDEPHQGRALLALSPRLRRVYLSELSNEQIVSLLNFLDPDKATDLLQQLSPKRAEKVKTSLNEGIKEKVESLLKFDPRTAAGMMSLDYVLIQRDSEFGEASTLVITHEERTGRFPTVLVEEEGKLIGELPLTQLIGNQGRKPIEGHTRSLPTLRYDQEAHEVIRLFRRFPHKKVAVLDEEESVLGVIHSDDILAILGQKAAQSLYSFAGVDVEEDVLDPPWRKVRARYKWLLLNLGTAFMAASVIGLFEETIARLVLVAVYMPIVAGMGGNAGNQAMAVTVRGLVQKKINNSTAWRVIRNEVTAGLINGVINGIVVAGIAIMLNGNPVLGIVFAAAMVVNLVIAGFFGAAIPITMKKLGKDPATSASVFITTATDVIGFFVFLSLATMLL